MTDSGSLPHDWKYRSPHRSLARALFTAARPGCAITGRALERDLFICSNHPINNECRNTADISHTLIHYFFCLTSREGICWVKLLRLRLNAVTQLTLSFTLQRAPVCASVRVECHLQRLQRATACARAELHYAQKCCLSLMSDFTKILSPRVTSRVFYSNIHSACDLAVY